jgi:hypothetical protein
MPPKFADDIVNAAQRSYPISHGLGTADVIWQLRESSTGEVVRLDRTPVTVVIDGPNQLTLTVPPELAGHDLRIVVIG